MRRLIVLDSEWVGLAGGHTAMKGGKQS